ncbi:copper resistance protein CopC [Nonomuraea sp. M3C6]|uniref:Copper resistance protein CopC n=1 Tax=Nonomuraea marmarensis TaxID=3351344 RepID=A0ABW7AU89_9ACTN
MRTLIVRLAIMIAVAVAGLLATALPAAAHPTLVATLPEAGYSVSESPEEIGLVFDEPVTVNKFVVEGQARGQISTTAVQRTRDGKVLVRPTAPLPAGRYTVRWQITAQDGDVVDSAFGFGVGVGVAAAQTQQQASTPGLGAAAVLRWALFAGLALALGGLAGDSLVRRLAQPTEPPEGRSGSKITTPDIAAPRPLIIVGCLLGLAASLGLGLHQIGGGQLVTGLAMLSPERLIASPAGLVIAVELAAFAAAVMAALSPARFLAALPLAVIVIVEGERSHLMAAAGGLGGFTIAVHLAAVALWIGALLHVARAAWAWRSHPARARAVLVAYAWLAIVVYAVVVVTGVVAALWILPSLGALVTTDYGWTLLTKLALVAVATGLALTARRRLTRPAEVSRIAVTARVEAVVLVAVLAASGLLTALPPPADPERGLPYPPPMAGPTIRLGALTGQVTAAIVAGEGRLEVRLRVPEWDPARDEGFTVRGALTAPDGTRQDLLLTPCGSGCFAGPSRWRTGVNTVELAITTDRWRGGSARFAVPWPARTARDLFDQARATLAAERSVTFVETVSSDTGRAAGFSKQLRMSGAELLGKQPYRAGVISEPVVLERTGDKTVLAFAISAESIYVRMTVDSRGRILREDMTTPNHQITRAFRPTEG